MPVRMTTNSSPTRFGDPGDHPAQGQLAKSDSGKFEATHESPATTSHETTICQPNRAGIAGKLGNRGVILLFLQFRAEFRILLNCLPLALVALCPGFFRHKSERGI